MSFRNLLTRLVCLCTRHPWPVIVAFAILGGAAALHAGTRFSISTDTDKLLPPSLHWRQRQIAYDRAFPAHSILVVVDAPTIEQSADATARLAASLGDGSHSTVIRSVSTPGSGPFYDREGLLFADPDALDALVGRLDRAAPLVGVASRDPSLRGAMQVLEGLLRPAPAGPPDGGTDRLVAAVARAAAASVDGTADGVGWQAALSGGGASRHGPSHGFIEVEPVLDFTALEPGAGATRAIHDAVERLRLGPLDGATIRLTGTVPIDDEQFATLQNGQVTSLLGTAAAVLLILFLALRSVRIIAAVAATLGAGFALTSSAGLLMVGSFNLISIAFAVLFVGLGADFGIQFSVRYRAERHEYGSDRASRTAALEATAVKAGIPLSLAAVGTTVGFFSFLPTAYRGVSQLGLIAGVGMLIAFTATVTLLPALLTVLNPPGEPRRMGFAWLAGPDRFIASHRFWVVGGTLGVVVLGLPLLGRLQFDFDPTHLQVASAPAVKAYRDLARDAENGIESINLVAPDLARATAIGRRLASLPEVASVRTVAAVIPTGQGPKLARLADLRARLAPVLAAPRLDPPTDRQVVEALRAAAVAASGAVPARTALAHALDRLAGAGPSARARAAVAIARPLGLDIERLRAGLQAGPVSVATLPEPVAREWLTRDGRARLEVLPRGDAGDDVVLARFADAVQKAAPDATGMPIGLIESRRTVVTAFAQAGICAVLSIAVVLALALRRTIDVVLTLLPLLVAGLVTLEISVLIGQTLNFSNIIALPLLLGVGVAFKIYYVMAWRHGATNLLQSTLTRAVLFSAMTTATAFGSLWLSPEPGLSSMGEMMALALACTMAAAVLFQPALMGPPRVEKAAEAGCERVALAGRSAGD